MAWVIVGLGNPGGEYRETRHNVGRMAVEFFAEAAGFKPFKTDKLKRATVSGGMVGKKAVALVLPDTFMNRSGSAVGKYVKSQKAAEQLIVVYDDLDLPLGRLKLSFDRGSGGHKGMESVMRAVKTKKFTRVRVGVSPAASGALRKPKGEEAVNDFILTRFRANELALLRPVLYRVADALKIIVLDGREKAMNGFN